MFSVGWKIARLRRTPKLTRNSPKSNTCPCQMKVTIPKIGMMNMRT